MYTNGHDLIIPADPILVASVSGLVRVTCKRRVQREVLLNVHLFYWCRFVSISGYSLCKSAMS